MSETITTKGGTIQLPLDSLEIAIEYSGDFVSTMTVEYMGVTYVQTFTNDGTNITNISQWEAQP